MGRATSLLLAVLAAALLAVAMVSDRALVARGRMEASDARRQAEERARLQALAVRATIAQIEQDIGAGKPPAGATHDVLAIPPEELPIVSPGSYATMSRDDLAALLGSRDLTPQGYPVAAIAAILYGTADARAAAAEKLLRGELRIRPEDVPTLAAELHCETDPRVERLVERLRSAPDPAGLPRLPGFRRSLRAGMLEGWAIDAQRWVHYAIPGSRVLALAAVPPGVTLAAVEDAGASAEVPDVAGMAVSAAAASPPSAKLLITRGVLWVSMATVLGALLVTARALARERRAVAREKAFLGSVTHELRTPLAGMRVLGETLAEGRGDPVEYGQLVARETERMETMVEQVLAATRADQAPTFHATRPTVIARSALEVIRARADRRGVRVTLAEPADDPEVLWDGEAVRRALLNLLDNAVRHGASPGNVLMSLAAVNGTVRLAVADDGPGIARRDRGRIFERFGRGTTTAPGTGLGLYLVDQVARSHGGRVDLETAEGRGSRFTLVLPVRPPAAEAP